ncbi:MAG: recombinase family protein [Alphaproteobacteria bacterium]
MKIGYARVSTDEQTLDLQIDALRACGCVRVFHDHGVSGVTDDRPGLTEALAAIDAGDVLVVWKLDRLGRSLSFLIDLIEDLHRRDAGFQSLTDGIDTTTPSGTLVFHIMGALAEFERTLIVERTVAGMEAARRRGKHIGRPRKLTDDQVRQAAKLTAENKLQDVADTLGVDRSTLSKAIKRLRAETAEGAQGAAGGRSSAGST